MSQSSVVLDSKRLFRVEWYARDGGLLWLNGDNISAKRTRVELVFVGVKAAAMQTESDGLEIVEVGPEYLAGYPSNPQELYREGDRVYRIGTSEWSGYVLCAEFLMNGPVSNDGRYANPAYRCLERLRLEIKEGQWQLRGREAVREEQPQNRFTRMLSDIPPLCGIHRKPMLRSPRRHEIAMMDAEFSSLLLRAERTEGHPDRSDVFFTIVKSFEMRFESEGIAIDEVDLLDVATDFSNPALIMYPDMRAYEIRGDGWVGHVVSCYFTEFTDDSSFRRFNRSRHFRTNLTRLLQSQEPAKRGFG